MERPDTHIKKLKQEIIATLGRTIDSLTDFDYLSIKIAEKTGDSISVSTLKRLFGYVKGAGTPRPSTLSSLARYAGYSGWSEFCATHTPATPPADAPPIDAPPLPPAEPTPTEKTPTGKTPTEKPTPIDARHRTAKTRRRLALLAIVITITALVILALMACPRVQTTTTSKTATTSKVDTLEQ